MNWLRPRCVVSAYKQQEDTELECSTFYAFNHCKPQYGAATDWSTRGYGGGLSMSIPTVRLAFQGGGAKLAAMLPIADAFATAARRSDISISAVSGTSAGAICAALVAVEADFDKVRRYIVSSGPSHMAALVPPRVARLAGQIGSKGNIGAMKVLLNADLLRGIALKGQPVLNESGLSNFVQGLLNSKGTSGPVKIEDCPVRLIVTASDIVRSRGVMHESGSILDAICDSCSLPILVRSFNSLASTHHVDGGLCDNLPVESLITGGQDVIFAVFPKPVEENLKITNIIAYISSLLSASIGHSAARSASLVSKPFQFEADTKLGLLDFSDAISQLGDQHWYEGEKDKALRRIRDFSNSYGVALSPNQARVADVTGVHQYQEALSELSDVKRSNLVCLSARFLARINSDQVSQDEIDKTGRPADTLTRTVRYKVIDRVPEHYVSHVKINDDRIIPTIWSVRNITRRKEVPIRALPMLTRKVLDYYVRDCMIQFVNSGDNISLGEEIEIQSVYHSGPGEDFLRLNLGKSDTIGLANTGYLVPNAELILVYPKRIGKVSILFDQSESKSISQNPEEIIFTEDEISYVGLANSIIGLRTREFQPDARFGGKLVVDRA